MLSRNRKPPNRLFLKRVQSTLSASVGLPRIRRARSRFNLSPERIPRLYGFPRSRKISETQTPLLPFAQLLLPLPLQGEIKRGPTKRQRGMPEAVPGCPRPNTYETRGKCPKDKGGTQRSNVRRVRPNPPSCRPAHVIPAEAGTQRGSARPGATPVNGGNVPRRVTTATTRQVGQRGTPQSIN